MKTFLDISFDPKQCRAEVTAFQKLLATKAKLSERKDLLPFFRAHLQLAACLGFSNAGIGRANCLAFEYDLFGDFACDVVVGDSSRGAFTFVEFEDAAANSIFVKKKGKNSPEWAPRFDHGFSQIIDWLYKLRDMERTDEFRARFGEGIVHYEGLLVIGRNQPLSQRELRRLDWRQQYVVVNSKHVRCMTFDQLAEDALFRLKDYPIAAQGVG